MLTRTENYRVIMWGIPVVTILHNIEEALLLSHFMDEYNRLMPEFAAAFVGLATFESLLFVLFLTSVLPVILVWGTNIRETPNIFEILLYCFACAMLINVLPHITITLIAGSYSPGLLSSLFLVVPATVFLFISAFRRKRLTAKQWPIVVIGGIILHGPALLALLAIGNRLLG